MKKSNVKKAIVTGGAGFIGSHLVDSLAEIGCEVIVLDNLAGGRLDNIQHHLDDGTVEFHYADICQDGLDESIFDDVDWVFHLAALADIVPSVVEPAKYFDANIKGTWQIAEAARKAGVKKLVYAASSSCYGIARNYPTSESEPIDPQYPYALSKYLAEEIVLNWGKIYGLEVISLRLFNVFGPRHRTSGTYGAVFGVFLAQKLAGVPLTIVGDGTQTRDFTYVSDVIEAFIRAAESDISNKVFNIGSGSTCNINYLAELLGGDEVVYIPKRPGEPDCTFADITKARKILGYKPKVSFADGVEKVLDHIELWKDATVWTPEKIAEATTDWFKYLCNGNIK